MKIVLKKSDALKDWYLIVRAEHDGLQWLERTGPNSMRLMLSERISDADIEGSADEMLALAEAIQNRKNIEFRRCAVEFVGYEVHLWSPRNSIKEGVVSIREADEFAEHVMQELGGSNETA